MSRWFADTFYFLALRNPDAGAHAAAVEAAKQLGSRQLVTTEWVLTEVGDALSSPKNRQGFLDLLTVLRQNSQVLIIDGLHETFERGVALFQARMDKSWTLTDCISFVVMR